MEQEYHIKFSVKKKDGTDMTKEFMDSLYGYISQMEGPSEFFEYELLRETSEKDKQMNVIVTKSKELADVLPDSMRETKRMDFKGRSLRLRILPTKTIDSILIAL